MVGVLDRTGGGLTTVGGPAASAGVGNFRRGSDRLDLEADWQHGRGVLWLTW